jgi:hypothetical protein
MPTLILVRPSLHTTKKHFNFLFDPIVIFSYNAHTLYKLVKVVVKVLGGSSSEADLSAK